VVGFHLSGYRTFKGYSTQHVLPHPLHYFPRLVSSQCFSRIEHPRHRSVFNFLLI
jgi:hypothetical protein